MKLSTVIVQAVLVNASLGHAASKKTQLLQHRRGGEPKEAPRPRELSSYRKVTAGVEAPATTLSLDDFFGTEVKDDADNDLDTFFGTESKDDNGDDLDAFFGTESKDDDGRDREASFTIPFKDDDDALDDFFDDLAKPNYDICTIGDSHPSQPLYFCMQGGTCLDRVSSNEPHPGCACVDGWTGESCEIRVRSSQTSHINGALIMVVIAIAGVVLAAFCLVFFCIRARSDTLFQFLRLRRRRNGHAEQDGLVNIAPRKNMSGNMYDIAVAASSGGKGMPSSSRDPFLGRLAFTPTRQDVSTESDDSDDDEPRIVIHPVDEDNRRLHDVSII